MESSVFGEISLIVAIGSIIAFIMKYLKQPLIVGHIITGVLVGPIAFDLVRAEDTVELFAEIGIALLLFIIGLGLNPRVIKELGKVSFLVAGLQMIVTTIFGLITSIIFGLDLTTSFIIGITISFSSTIIGLKTISDKKEQTRLYGRLVIGLLLVQDIVATIALLLLSTSHGDGFTFGDGFILLFKGGLLGGGLYLINTYIFSPLKQQIAESQEFLFLFALGWGLGVPALFELSGFSFEVGALFAGVTLATQNYAQEVAAKLRPLRDFFIVLFFVDLGVGIQLTGLIENFLLVIVLCLIVLVIEPIVVMLGLGFMGYTKRTSFLAGVTMTQVSEFSIVFIALAASREIVESEIVSLLIVVSLLTIAVSAYIMKYSERIFLRYEDKIKLFENKIVELDQVIECNYQAIIFGYKKGGSEFVKTFTKMNKKFVVVDYDPSIIEMLDHEDIHYIYGDATDTELLEEIGIENAKIIVSTFTDHQASLFLVQHINKLNPGAIILLHADKPLDAEELYVAGATYVMLPHYIGSEKLSSFISRHGFKKSEFNKWRDKHVSSIQEIL